MQEIVRFDVPEKKIISNKFIGADRYKLAKGGTIFRATFYNDLSVIIHCDKCVPVHGGYCEQNVYLFDKLLVDHHVGGYVLAFYGLESAVSFYSFRILQITGFGSRSKVLGELHLTTDKVIFNGKVIDTKQARLLFTKAAFLSR